MGSWNVRFLVVSFGVCLGLGVAGGLIYAWLADKNVWYALGTVLLLIGLIALAMGLLGATEPEEGWASTRRRATGRGRAESVTGERQSMVARLGADSGGMSTWEMVVWGVGVGGGLVLLAGACFALAT